MISSTNIPKTKTQLVQQISKLSPSTKFEVVEVFSMKDKPTMNKLFDKHLKNGHFTILFIDGGK
jgi:uncharacterized protein with PIN domain